MFDKELVGKVAILPGFSTRILIKEPQRPSLGRYAAVSTSTRTVVRRAGCRVYPGGRALAMYGEVYGPRVW